MTRLPVMLEARLERFARALVDQHRAEVLVRPNRDAEGFWFGGGNVVNGPDGSLYLTGRYRNAGDSRTGLGAGERGLELALFRSSDQGRSFSKILSFSKKDLASGGHEVVSIEGAKLSFDRDRVELFVSSEKRGISYPSGFESYLKPGAGVWTIDLLEAPSVAALHGASARTVIAGTDPQFIHCKDPVLYHARSGATVLYFCTHPFSWASSNTAIASRIAGSVDFTPPQFSVFPRGACWDVAVTRVTGVCRVPSVGPFAEVPPLCMVFYDGAESLRPYEEHPSAVKRPRGYSCEELGGLAYVFEDDFSTLYRLSTELPFFVSPRGTGCSRYVDVHELGDGYLATWQQSQESKAQPLVVNRMSRATAAAILEGRS